MLRVALAGFLCLTSLTASGQSTDSTAASDSLLLQLQEEMASMTGPASTTLPGRARPSTNPDISVIGDVRGSFRSGGDRNVDVGFHEAEFAFKSVVDPFARGDFYVAGAEEEGEFALHLEEAYLTTLALPGHLQLKVGKFRSAVGKINRLHPHSLSFIDTPLVYERLFGDEGLNDQGVSVSWLVPNRRFYQELTLEVTNGPTEAALFSRSESNHLLYVSHLKNFLDLSDDATLEIGLTGVLGPNEEGRTTRIGGLDLTYRWKPLRFNTYRSLLLQAELFVASRQAEGDAVDTWGLYGLGSYQLSRRVFLTGRIDRSEDPILPAGEEYAGSATLGWNLTEFQKLEIGARSYWAAEEAASLTGLIRLVFVIGTHGAHEY